MYFSHFFAQQFFSKSFLSYISGLLWSLVLAKVADNSTGSEYDRTETVKAFNP
jgi:hypothetical protein